MDFEMLHILKIKFSAICNKKTPFWNLIKYYSKKIRMNSKPIKTEAGPKSLSYDEICNLIINFNPEIDNYNLNFTKYAYRLPKSLISTIIWYQGDETLHVPVSHDIILTENNYFI
jgi:hypothetical protein